MTTDAPTIQSPLLRVPLRVLFEHNPFYLLSAACMLGGCLALTNSLSWTSIPVSRLMALIVTLQIYEAALIALGLFLVARRGLMRDGRVLLVLAAVFLVDITFLNAEIVTLDLQLGLIVNAILLALAALKLWVVLRVLRPTLPGFQVAFIILQLATLFALPCFLRWMDDDGRVAPVHFYAGWWMLALLPAAQELLARLFAPATDNSDASPNAAPARAYLALPWISLLVHLSILHYVYDTRFYGAHAAPVLLGLTLILTRAVPDAIISRGQILLLRLALPVAAVMVSLNNPAALNFPFLSNDFLTVTPLKLASAGAYLTYVYCFFLPHALFFLAAGAVIVLWDMFGLSRSQLADAGRDVWRWSLSTIQNLLPGTISGWGVLAIVWSFVFLAIGAAISLLKPSPPRATR